jgi:hypothetical protein
MTRLIHYKLGFSDENSKFKDEESEEYFFENLKNLKLDHSGTLQITNQLC